MAKKARGKKKTFSKEEMARAAGVAAGLEASFTQPPPPGAMAPAPLLDEIREMGEVGVAGVLSHLSSTTPEGRIPTLRALAEIADPSVVPKLISLIGSMRWSLAGLAALIEAVRGLDPAAALPGGLDAGGFEQARAVAQRLAEDVPLSADDAKRITASLGALPPVLQEVALRDGLAGGENLLALAGAMAAGGATPPAHFIDALARMGTQDAANALQSLAAGTDDKDALAQIRKAAFRLRNKGVAAEKAHEAAAAPPAQRAGSPDYVHAVASAVDGRGQMLLWIARSRVPRGRYLAQARLHRGRGIVEFTDADMSAKELRGVFERISEVPTLATQQVPAGYALWLIERGQRENEAGDTPLPQGFTHAKLMLDPLAEPAAFPAGGAHPIRGLVKPLPAGEERMEAATMFSHRPFWGWAMDEERVAPFFQEFLESLEAQVAIDEQQRKERFQGIVEKGAAEIFKDAGVRGRIAGQLEDNGYIFHQAGDEAMARECVTLADEMDAGASETPPLFIEMVRYAVSAMLERIVRQTRQAQGESADAPDEVASGEDGGGDEEKSAGAEDSPVIITP